MALKKSLFNTAYRLSEGWLIFSVILMIYSYFRMANDPSLYLSDIIAVLFVTATIGTIPFAILKFIKKGKEKRSIGNIQ